MDKFKDDQRFHGMDKFHLANSVQDPSYLSELICGELFRAAGVPASRVAHAVVTINGRPRGLYYVKEGYDEAFLEEALRQQRRQLLRRRLPPRHRPAARPHPHEEGRRRPRRPEGARRRGPRSRTRRSGFKKLEKLLDLDAFISFMVLEVITWDWDGYPFNCNNYRIYHDPGRTRSSSSRPAWTRCSGT